MADASANVAEDVPEEAPEPTPPPKRRRRWLWFGLPLLLLVLAGWFAPAIVARTSLRQRILPWLVPAYPAAIETAGADLDWLSPVVLRDVVLHDLDGEPLLAVGRIETSLPLWKLAVHEGDVGTLRLVEPVLHVRARGDGTNLEDVLAPLLEPTDTEADSRLGFVLEATEGTVHVVGSDGERTGTITLTAATVTRTADAAEPTTVRVEGTVDDGERSGTLVSHVRLRDVPAGLAEFDGRIETRDVPLAAFAALGERVRPGAHLSGRLNADVRLALDPSTARPADGASTDAGTTTAYFARIRTAVTHLDARLPGLIADDRLLLERLAIDGDLRVSTTRLACKGVRLTSDVGRVAFDGAIPLDAIGEAATLRGLLEVVTRSRHELDAVVDLRTLAAVLPRTTRVREDLELESGRVRVESSTALVAGRPAWSIRGGVRDLAGRLGERSVRWDEPVVAEAFIPRGRNGAEVERLSLRADFARVDGRRTESGTRLDVDCDLDRLHRELARFVDLGDVELAGTIRGNGEFAELEPGRWRTDLDLVADRFVLAWPDRPRWSEPSLRVTAEAVGRGERDFVEHVETAHVDVVAGNDRLDLRLVDGVPWTDTPAEASWPLAYRLEGELSRWQIRLGPFVTFDGWSTAGVASIRGRGSFHRSRIVLDECKGTIRRFAVRGPDVRIDEPSVTIDATGEWNGEESFVRSPSLVVACRTAAVKAVDLRCEWSEGGPPRTSGGLAVRADLAGVQRWAGRTPSVTGSLSGNAKFQHTAPVTKSLWNVTVTDLAGASPTAGVDPGPVRLTGRLDYHHERDILAVRTANLAADGLAANVAGRVTTLTTLPTGDLSGDLEYDWNALGPRLRAYLGDVVVRGRGARTFTLKGPLDFSAGLPRELVATGGLGWESIDAHGLPVGTGAITASVSNGNVAVAPIDVTVAGGMLHTTPSLVSSPTGSVLVLSPDTTLTGVQLTPALTSRWLGYATPLLANGATTEGRFSAALTRSAIPLANWRTMDATGTVLIEEAHVTPGPMTNQLVGLIDRIRRLASGTGLGDLGPLGQLGSLGGLVGSPGSTRVHAGRQVVNVRVVNGRVFHDRFAVTVNGTPLRTSGSVGFDNTLDLVAELAVADEWLGDGPIATALKGRTLRIPVRGTTTAPRVDASILTDLASRVGLGAVRERMDRAVGEEISRGLESLFGAPR